MTAQRKPFHGPFCKFSVSFQAPHLSSPAVEVLSKMQSFPRFCSRITSQVVFVTSILIQSPSRASGKGALSLLSFLSCMFLAAALCDKCFCALGFRLFHMPSYVRAAATCSAFHRVPSVTAAISQPRANGQRTGGCYL